jgi:hypothetical protein
MVNTKDVPLGETIPGKLSILSISKMRNRGIQKLYNS